jgi:hypothetical protein
MSVANTITYDTFFEDVLQNRLDHPQTWKEMCDVTITDSGVIRSSYMSTTPSVQTVTRGTGAALQVFAETSETLTISTGRDLGVVVDLADLAQSPWTKPAELFDRIGHLLNEYIESAVLGGHAAFTNFGVGDLNAVGPAGDTAAITVTASNVDDIIRGVKRVIRTANGQSYMNQNGVGIVWRPADFEMLEAFVQANGFMTADAALKEGTVEGMKYMNVDHYWSNDFAAGHIMAAVKKMNRIGILRGTYGKAHTIPFPAADSNMFFSGTAFYSRVDIGLLTPTGYATIVLDVNVA